jgi:tripartite-type tricarboxylate transporter receptor subunit TctC
MEAAMNLGFRLVICAVALVTAGFAHAQNGYPTRPVRIIVPIGPGGPSDVIARLIAQKLSQKFGQPFVVENQPGGANNIGIGNVARSAPDGYTILLVGSNFTINPGLFSKIPYDPIKDFEPITLAAVSPAVLITNSSMPAANLKELIAHLKANPGKYNYASPGVGTTGHLLGELFKLSQGVDLVYVPFNGMGPVLQSVLGGQTPVAFVALTPVVSLVKEGKLRALAVTTPRRSTALPAVPTVAESGLADLEADVPQGFLAPAGTPKQIVDLLNREISNAIAQEDVKAKLAAIGFDAVASTPAEFAARINAEIARWRKVITEARIEVGK